MSRPSVIRSVLNPNIPLSEGELPRTAEPELSNYDDPDLLNVLGHCFTDPLFQSLLRFPDGTELTPAQVDEVLSCAEDEAEQQEEVEEEVEGRPGGSVLKMLGEPGLEWKSGPCSVMAGPEMCLTTEEKHRLTDLFNRQVSACRDCMPLRWVGGFTHTELALFG